MTKGFSKEELKYSIKEKIRSISIGSQIIGNDTSFSFMKENENVAKPLIAIEMLYIQDASYPEILRRQWTENITDNIIRADKSNADIISIKFNIAESDFEKEKGNIVSFINDIHKYTKKPVILRGANNTAIDLKLIPLLAKSKTPSIIAFAEEETYEKIVPYVIQNSHILVLRTPIDINIAKELNILSTDKGLPPDRILIDPDMGGLGYGLDYGYSIIEKIRQAAFDGDTMLNMPIIAFIGEETYRAKEAKSDTFDKQWGEYNKRATMWEISGATAMITAGANIVVLWNTDSVNAIKGVL